ncbi:MAG: hypothetical protein JW763_05670 [candidate division Zixibacteria bacterium]|nr:hypothetical protein [candidate division Zixibacteria bacterium]
MTGKDFCFFHNPETADQVKAAGRIGGKNSRDPRNLPADTPDIKIESSDDIMRLLGETISQVRRGQINPKIANSIGYLVSVILKTREQGEFEERIKQLEEMVSCHHKEPVVAPTGGNIGDFVQ